MEKSLEGVCYLGLVYGGSLGFGVSIGGFIGKRQDALLFRSRT